MALDQGKIYGRGIAFPPRVDPEGRIAWSAGPQNIRESIRIILLTNEGERVRLRDFGAGLQPLLFDPNTPARHRQLKDRIEGALARWEPRIVVRNVQVEADPDNPETAIVTLEYELVANRAAERITFNVGLAAG